jgi:hypothetical protein
MASRVGTQDNIVPKDACIPGKCGLEIRQALKNEFASSGACNAEPPPCRKQASEIVMQVSPDFALLNQSYRNRQPQVVAHQIYATSSRHAIKCTVRPIIWDIW